MATTFLTINEQIDLLKSRNLIIDNDDEAEFFLLRNNYYNLINCFGKFFQCDRDIFISGTNFKEIMSLFHFDREVKTALFDRILDVEMHLKTLVSYYFSKEYPKEYDYLNTNNFGNSDILDVTSVIASFSKTIQRLSKRKNDSTVHYINRYKHIPLWVLIGNFDFGQTVNLIRISDDKIKNNISRELSLFLKDNISNPNAMFTLQELDTAIEIIREARNVIAHNNKILDFNSKKHFKYNRYLHPRYSINKTEPRSNIYNLLISLQIFLSPAQYAVLHNTILKRTKNLSKKISTIPIGNILKSLGFPPDWHLTTSKLSQ